MGRSVAVAGLVLVLAACSAGGDASSSPTPAPSSSVPAPASSSAAPESSSEPQPSDSASASPSQILAVLCDTATKKQVAALEAAMKPGYSVSKLVDVRTDDDGVHAILGIVKGPDASGIARWVGDALELNDLQSADQAAATSSTAPPMTDVPPEAIDYLNQTMECYDAIYK